jgi:ABC-type uncharacterized transport system permease subunit
MSLKALHLVFVNAFSALSFGLAVWMLKRYLSEGQPADLAYGVGSILAGIAIVVYGIRFLKKLKHISYL